MASNAKARKKEIPSVDVERKSVSQTIDTSLLYEELRRAYEKKGAPLEVDFRKLVGWVKLGDQLTHQLHPYPAKLLPHIAHFFVRAGVLQRSGQGVLDPFCGSGTVALEASVAGHTPYVADANPFALLLTKVKTTPYEATSLRETHKTILQRARRFRVAPEIAIVNGSLWYSEEKKRALEIILRAVSEIEDEDQRDFFRICFSVTARRVSFADPAISVPVRLREKESFGKVTNEKIAERLRWVSEVSPLADFASVVEANIRRVEVTNRLLPDRLPAIHVGTDARALENPNQTGRKSKAPFAALVVTSPPYGSAQKYVRASSLSLNWLGFAAPDKLSSLEARSIGREHLPKNVDERADKESLPAPYKRFIKKVSKTNELRGRITSTYLDEMRDVVKEVSRVTMPGGHAVFVVGNNQVCGETLRNDDYLVHSFAEEGLELELSLVDQIKSRGLMTKRNGTASVISREAVLVFRKRG